MKQCKLMPDDRLLNLRKCLRRLKKNQGVVGTPGDWLVLIDEIIKHRGLSKK